MRGKFEEQLETLNVELIKMGALCEHAIALASKSVFNYDETLVNMVKKSEADIDGKERDIEALCMNLILTQQPVATDLRYISAVLKIISDLERIGDQANEIAEITKILKGFKLENDVYLTQMSKAVVNMLTQSVESYVVKDEERAKRVIKTDDEVDELFVKIRQELIETIARKSLNSEVYVDYLMIAKYFERIGDHTVNVAQWVIYSISGKHEGK